MFGRQAAARCGQRQWPTTTTAESQAHAARRKRPKHRRAGLPPLFSGLVLLLLVSACGGMSKSAVVTVTTTVPTAPAPKTAIQDLSFRLPSGNIVCDMKSSVTCRLLSAGNKGFALASTGLATSYPTNAAYIVPSRVLAYGTSIVRGPFVCQSSVSGLFCHTANRTNGLFLSRQQQILNGPAPSTPSIATTPPPPAASPPSPPAPPATVSDKDFSVQDLQIKDDGLGDIGGIARLTNTSSKSLTGTFTFTFFQGGKIVGTAIAVANSVGPGQTVTVDLSSQDPMITGQFRYQFQVDTEF
jgi:hypothetical protein